MKSLCLRSLPVLVSSAVVLCAVGAAPALGGEVSSRARGAVRMDSARASLSLQDYEGPSFLLAAAGERPAEPSREAPSRKNPLAAFLMSSVLPGWGELYAGHTARGRGFVAADAAIWLGYAAFEIQGAMRTDDYEEHARTFAGVGGHIPDGYYEDIADYIRSEGDDSYNESVRSDARSLYPDDLDAQREYFAANGYFGDLAWDWDSQTRFREYRDLRHGAHVSSRNAFYMTGLAVLNRAVSAIDSAWMARRHNEGARSEPRVSISVAPEMDGGTLGSRAALEFAF